MSANTALSFFGPPFTGAHSDAHAGLQQSQSEDGGSVVGSGRGTKRRKKAADGGSFAPLAGAGGQQAVFMTLILNELHKYGNFDIVLGPGFRAFPSASPRPPSAVLHAISQPHATPRGPRDRSYLCPCLSDTDGCLRSDIVPDSPHQAKRADGLPRAAAVATTQQRHVLHRYSWLGAWANLIYRISMVPFKRIIQLTPSPARHVTPCLLACGLGALLVGGATPFRFSPFHANHAISSIILFISISRHFTPFRASRKFNAISQTPGYSSSGSSTSSHSHNSNYAGGGNSGSGSEPAHSGGSSGSGDDPQFQPVGAHVRHRRRHSISDLSSRTYVDRVTRTLRHILSHDVLWLCVCCGFVCAVVLSVVAHAAAHPVA